MTSRLFSIAVVVGIFGAVFLLFDGREIAPAENTDKRSEVQDMVQAGMPADISETGFSYSPKLAKLFGLPEGDATDLHSPLLGAAIQIRAGTRGGSVCLLHVLFDTSIDIRLPDEQQMHAIGSNIDVFPNGFLQRPNSEVRQHIAAQVGALSHRAIFRNGRDRLTDAATAGDDPNGSYTSMPLGGYNREFVPGVGWLVMSVNCELAGHDEYSHASLFVERNSSPSDMILNGHVDPSKMIEFRIPQLLIDGMRATLRASANSDGNGNANARAGRFTIISK
ncbi:MAG: hypothetical protein OEM51_09095 [Gammaproteobacteria bacterium]|nr:hypothetical protein [Gammaproteobacteria bacterium]